VVAFELLVGVDELEVGVGDGDLDLEDVFVSEEGEFA